jgi:hypothetical protein
MVDMEEPAPHRATDCARRRLHVDPHDGEANPCWGAPRIHGELLKLGINVCQATVAKYMGAGDSLHRKRGARSCRITSAKTWPPIFSWSRRRPIASCSFSCSSRTTGDASGHTNAALASYAELNCDGVLRQPYTGIDVGFSSVCVDKPATYAFIDDVVREIAAITPGAYFHVGGDEVKTLTPEQYVRFIERMQEILQAHGKQMIGWDEVAPARLLPTTLVSIGGRTARRRPRSPRV